MGMNPRTMRPKRSGVSPFAMATVDGDVLLTADGEELRFVPLPLPLLPTVILAESYGTFGTVGYRPDPSPISPETFRHYFDGVFYPVGATTYVTSFPPYYLVGFSGDFEDRLHQMEAINASGSSGLTAPFTVIEV